MKRKFFCFFFLSNYIFLSALYAIGNEWREVEPGDSVRLPQDLYFKREYRVQWWYLTGHLYDQAGREFGYEMTFFAAGVQQRPYQSRFGVDFIYLSHIAVSDVSGKRFYHSPDADAGSYGFAGADRERFHVWVDNDSLQGSPQKMHVNGRADGIALDLSLVPRKPAVLHGDHGYSRKSEASPLIASLYFSFTDLETAGTLTLEKSTFVVGGKSWFDRELSTRGLAGDEAGWDWYAIQLDDGREIMLYVIRKKEGTIDPSSSGTIVYQDGTYRHFEKKDFSVRILDHYGSRHTQANYPSRWKIIIPSENLSLTISPLIQDQEFTAAGAIRNTYWEGTCTVEGSARGRAYVEMTGYADTGTPESRTVNHR